MSPVAMRRLFVTSNLNDRGLPTLKFDFPVLEKAEEGGSCEVHFFISKERVRKTSSLPSRLYQGTGNRMGCGITGHADAGETSRASASTHN